MAFTDNIFPPVKRKQLQSCLDLVDIKEGKIAEVGTREGRSTIVIAKHFSGEKVHVVDHWMGDLTDPSTDMAKRANERDVFADFKNNMERHGVWNEIEVHRADWRNVLWQWNDPLKFLFLDAEHTYYEVKDQIREGLRILVKGGVMCGDDFTRDTVKKAIPNAE